MISIFDLKRQYKTIKPEIDAAFFRVAENGWFTLGREVEEFEREFGEYLSQILVSSRDRSYGVAIPLCQEIASSPSPREVRGPRNDNSMHSIYSVGVGSGTDALTLAVKALDIKPGEEVILPTNSYPTVFGIALSGVKIKLVDCGEDGQISLESLAKILSKKTKAVVVVHLYGSPADVYGVQEVIKRKGLDVRIIEDCAQGHGARFVEAGEASESQSVKELNLDTLTSDALTPKCYNVGTFGDIAIFSFYPSKNLGAYGDGGLVVTRDERTYEHLKRLRMYGESSRYMSEEISGVSRLDELQAAILRVKLRHLDEWVARRREIADIYNKGLEGVGDIKFVNYVASSMYYGKNTNTKNNHSTYYKLHTTIPCYHLFVIRTKKRDQLQKYLAEEGIQTAVHYPTPIHLTKSFTYLGYTNGDFPIAEQLAGEVLSLPIYHELTNSEVEQVISSIKKFYK